MQDFFVSCKKAYLLRQIKVNWIRDTTLAVHWKTHRMYLNTKHRCIIILCSVSNASNMRHCNPEVHQLTPLCLHQSPVRAHPTGARTQTIPLPTWGIVWRQLLHWQQNRQTKAKMSGNEAAVKTVWSITGSLSCDRAAADETPTRSSNKEQMIMQQESNPQRLLTAVTTAT